MDLIRSSSLAFPSPKWNQQGGHLYVYTAGGIEGSFVFDLFFELMTFRQPFSLDATVQIDTTSLQNATTKVIFVSFSVSIFISPAIQRRSERPEIEKRKQRIFSLLLLLFSTTVLNEITASIARYKYVRYKLRFLTTVFT